MLHITCSKQKLPINKLKAYYGPKPGTVLGITDSRIKRCSFLHQLAFSLVRRSINIGRYIYIYVNKYLHLHLI